jgi:hypothetical protein
MVVALLVMSRKGVVEEELPRVGVSREDFRLCTLSLGIALSLALPRRGNNGVVAASNALLRDTRGSTITGEVWLLLVTSSSAVRFPLKFVGVINFKDSLPSRLVKKGVEGVSNFEDSTSVASEEQRILENEFITDFFQTLINGKLRAVICGNGC